MKTIRSKLIIALLFFTLVPVAFIGSISFLSGMNALREAQLKALEAVADLRLDKIDAFFREQTRNIQSAQAYFNIKTNLPILSRLEKSPGSAEYLRAREMLDGQLQVFHRANHYIDVMLVNPEGRILYTTSSEHTRKELGKPLPDPGNQSFLKGRKGIYFSTPFLNPMFSNKPSMLIAAPAHDFLGRFIGLIVFEIEMAPIYALLQDRTGLGESGETLIAKKNGDDILFLSHLLHENTPSLSKHLPIESDIALPMVEAVQGREGSGVSRDYRPEAVVAAWRYIPIVDWGMVVKVDRQEAITSIVSLRKVLLILSVVFLLLGAVFAVLIADSISKPIQVLRQGMDMVGAGHLDFKVGTTAADEVGHLSRDFDRMAANLQRVTASRNDMNREIGRREGLEKELVALNTSLEARVEAGTKLAQDRAAELERANAELQAFTSIASHDLQEPLRKVISFGDLLKIRYEKNLEGKGLLYLERMQSATRRMQRLIDDLLSLSRVTSRAQPKVKLDLQKVLEEVLEDLEAAMDQTGGRVEVGPLPSLRGDKTQIYQLFLNLIGNALKYHQKDQAPEIRVSARILEKDWIEIAVSDNGIGFETIYLDRIFKPFQRLHGSETYKGTGMGLAICDKIVLRHGGSITAESKLGEGSIFKVRLPLIPPVILEQEPVTQDVNAQDQLKNEAL